MTEVSIRPLAGKRDLKRFIEVPYRLRRGDPQWVPPLRFERRRFLDRDRNPWFEHAEAQLLLAERDGEAVGRISAHVDQRWDEFQGGNDGMFGFLEAEDDPAVFGALIEAAAGWLRGRGRERMLGPMDFTLNDECGILIEGYDEPSMILEPWHPPYYPRRLEALGLRKEIDLLMWELWFGRLKAGTELHPLIHAAAQKSRDEGVVLRSMRKRDLTAEVARFMEVYNEAWGDNWGFVPITEAEVAFQAKNLRPILDENWAMIAERDIQRVVIGPDPANNDRLLDSIRELRGHGVRVSVLPDVSRVVSSAIELDRLSGLTLLGVRRFEITHSSKLIKRSFDLAGSSLALLVLAPVLIAIAIAIRLDTRGPVTFRQQRAGRHGEPFEMIKFRSMVVGAEQRQHELLHLNEGDGVFKIAADPRVTRVGRVIRRLHFDELPQLVNVVRGEMSLVGPRPLPLAEDRRIEGWHRRRLDLRPGITGPWQVLGSAKLPMREMVRLDYQYVADWSLWNDIRILLLTLGHMARARGV